MVNHCDICSYPISCVCASHVIVKQINPKLIAEKMSSILWLFLIDTRVTTSIIVTSNTQQNHDANMQIKWYTCCFVDYFHILLSHNDGTVTIHLMNSNS